MRLDPKYEPPTGTEVAIEVRWKDKDGKVKCCPAQQWIRNVQDEEALDANWVFAGSQFRDDPETSKEYYAGDSGDFVSVSNVPTATLDLPIRSRQRDGIPQLFEGFVENMPPAKTPMTIVLKPKVREEGRGEAENGDGKLDGPGSNMRARIIRRPTQEARPPTDTAKRQNGQEREGRE